MGNNSLGISGRDQGVNPDVIIAEMLAYAITNPYFGSTLTLNPTNGRLLMILQSHSIFLVNMDVFHLRRNIQLLRVRRFLWLAF